MRAARSITSPQSTFTTSGRDIVRVLLCVFVRFAPCGRLRLVPLRTEGHGPLVFFGLFAKYKETLRAQLRLGILHQRRPRLRHAVQHFCAAATTLVILRIGLGLRRLCRVCLCRICL